MMEAHSDLRKKVVRTKNISIQARANVITTYLMSKELHHASTWKQLSMAEARIFHISVMKIYGGLLGFDCPGCPHKTDNEVIAELESVAPLNMISHLRIKSLAKVAVSKNDALSANR